jgi:hypothetical protein
MLQIEANRSLGRMRRHVNFTQLFGDPYDDAVLARMDVLDVAPG